MLLGLLSSLLSSPLVVLEVLISSCLIYVLAIIGYRLTFHPLARYPGPFLARITDLYLAYHAYGGDRHLVFWRAHQKYGTVVRIGPNLLSFNSRTALKTIYGFRTNVRKADFYSAFPANKTTFNVHNSIDKDIHSRKRRVISNAFADSSIKSMECYILGNINAACRLIASSTDNNRALARRKAGEAWYGTPLDMAQVCDWLTFDIMGDLVFGKAFGMLENPESRFAIDLVSTAAKRHLICGTHLTLHKWHLDKLLFPSIAAKRAQYMAYSRAQAVERTQLGLTSDRKDFFYHLLNAKDSETGQGFDAPELWGESNLFIIAGSDTTSTALAATLFYLATHPHAYSRCAAEIRSTFASLDDIVQGPKLMTRCPYTRACIDEAMRLAPPVPGGLPRTVLPGGLSVDGEALPEGTDVLVPHYAIHHNPESYPEPFAYVPERWLGPDASTSACQAGWLPNPYPDSLQPAQEAFCPFSVGPRGCIGRGLAYVELMLSLGRVLWLFEMSGVLEGGEDGDWGGDGYVREEGGERRSREYMLKDTFTAAKEGPVVRFVRRQGVEEGIMGEKSGTAEDAGTGSCVNGAANGLPRGKKAMEA